MPDQAKDNPVSLPHAGYRESPHHIVGRAREHSPIAQVLLLALFRIRARALFGHLDEGEWGFSHASRVSRQGVIMFGLFRRRTTIIAEGLKIVGSVTAEGLVEVNGHIEGDLHCTSLVISPKASIVGGVEADRIVVNGRVEGPVRGGEVVLKAHAYVVGDIQHQTLAVESGAYFDGRSVRAPATNVRLTEKFVAKLRREPAGVARESASASAA